MRKLTICMSSIWELQFAPPKATKVPATWGCIPRHWDRSALKNPNSYQKMSGFLLSLVIF